MITWSHAQSFKRLDGWWFFSINLYLCRFGSHRPQGSGDISFFIYQVTSCGHVIAGSRKCTGWSPSAQLTSMLNVVTRSLVKVEIWYILIFNVSRRIHMVHMIILLQSVTIQRRRLFWHISYYKVRQSNFITKCDRLLLQSASGITKCNRLYYNVRQVLQSVTVITKWDVTGNNILTRQRVNSMRYGSEAVLFSSKNMGHFTKRDKEFWISWYSQKKNQ